ncbi:MAG: hypothetical protein AAGB29_03285 [Planctomycetota bacterium]
MGSFIDQTLVREDNAERVANAIEAITRRDGSPASRIETGAADQAGTGFAITTSRDGWLTVFNADMFAEPPIAQQLSAELSCDAFQFIVNDSDSWHYLLFRNGDMIDRYDSISEEAYMGMDESVEASEAIEQVQASAAAMNAAMEDANQRLKSLMPPELHEIYDRVVAGTASPEDKQAHLRWVQENPTAMMEVMSSAFSPANTASPPGHRDVSEHLAALATVNDAVAESSWQSVLASQSAFAEQNLARLLGLLGQPEVLANLSFQYLDELPANELADQGVEVAARLA